MAKKTVAAPAATQGTKKKKSDLVLNIRGKIDYFWDLNQLAWHYCGLYQDRLVVDAPYLTKEFIGEQVAYLTATQLLPNNVVRNSENTRALDVAKNELNLLVSLAAKLDASLGRYTDGHKAKYEVERRACGLESFRSATADKFAVAGTFIVSCNNYLDTYGQLLVDAGAMSPNFSQTFKDAGVAFNTAKTGNTNTKQSSKTGTETVAMRVAAIKKQVKMMQDFGKATFKDEPDVLKFFTEDYLLEAVRSKHPAGLNGRTTWPLAEGMEKAKPVAGLLVEVLDDTIKSEVTNKEGRFIFKQLSAGQHRVRISSPAGAAEPIEPVEMTVTLTAGVSLRRNVTVVAPVVVAPLAPIAEAVATVESAVAPDQSLAQSISEMNLASVNGAAV